MDSRSYIKLVGNLTSGGITGTTGTTYIPPIEPVKWKFVALPVWNMKHGTSGEQNSVVVETGLPARKIRDLTGFIRSDTGLWYNFANGLNMICMYADTGSPPINGSTSNACVVLNRDVDSTLDNSIFRGMTVSRGRLNIMYSGIQSPTGRTGNVSEACPTCITVNGNIVINDGGSPICEYGVVYSQSTASPTISNGCIVGTVANIGMNVSYGKILGQYPNNALQDGTNTYFRMYAKNCEEIGYGAIKMCATPSMPLPTSVTISVNRVNDNGLETDGYIDINPPLGAGQCITMALSYGQTVVNVASCSRICILCRQNGHATWDWCDCSSSIDPTRCLCTDYAHYHNSGGGLFPTICHGDCFCFQNYTDGDSGSCSCFQIHSYSASPGLTVIVGGTDSDEIVSI